MFQTLGPKAMTSMPTARQRRAPGTRYITPGKTKQHEDYWTAMHHIDVFYLPL